MLPTPQVIAIDDDRNHLEGLTRGLSTYGTACLPIHFSGDVAVPQCPHVRVIFADLHLSPGSTNNHAQHFAVLGGLIEEQLKPSGPYFIVLWTKYPDQANALRDFLHHRLIDVAKPFAVQALSKSDHLDSRGTINSPEGLVQAIRQIVAEQPQFGALLDWEGQVLEAAADTLSSILKLAGSTPANVSRLLAGLAVASVGKKHVEEDRFQAVNEALLPILADRVASMRSRDDDSTAWQLAFNASDLSQSLSVDEAARLNSLLHIDLVTDATSWTGRGAVIALPQRASGDKFKRTFGLDQSTVAQKSFGCRDFAENDNRFRWVLVQSQAACDYAQKQPGLVPFYLGLCLPVPSAGSRGEKPPAAVWSSPCFEFGGATQLRVSAGFQLSLSPTAKRIGTPLFRLREQLLNDLIYRVHSHGARPGIVSFRNS